MKQILPLMAALCLLTGCAAQSAPSVPDSTAPPPTAAPQTLTVYADDAALPALQAYADARGVTLTTTQDAESADLAVLDAPPAGEGWRDLLGDELLSAAASRAGVTEGPCYALPLGDTLYAYWADGAALTALLGDNAVTDLQNASWEEWQAFAEAFTDWVQDPGATKVPLSGAVHSLPETMPEGLTLDGLFAAPDFDTALYTPALLAAGSAPTAETLAGPLNGLCSALILEADNTGSAPLFCRATLSALAAERGAEGCEGLAAVPVKTDLVDSDLSTEEYNLTGLLNYPVLSCAGWLAVPAAADEAGAKAAASAILWLYSSGEGEKALTETLCLVTPWDTASDVTAPGKQQIEQVGAGILPAPQVDSEAADALRQAETALQTTEKRTKSDRTAFVEAAAAALAEE